VLGDAFAASVVAHYLQEQLEKMDNQEYHNEIKEEIGMYFEVIFEEVFQSFSNQLLTVANHLLLIDSKSMPVCILLVLRLVLLL
jgi:hypothetical protein